MAQSRKFKLGFILHGVGRTWNDWRHPDKDINASTSLSFYARQAQLAEKGIGAVAVIRSRCIADWVDRRRPVP